MRLDLLGQRFGRWFVTGRAENGPYKNCRWYCRCDCGTERVVAGKHLRSGESVSCGCQRNEAMREIAPVRFYKHGHARHGAMTSEYESWRSMLKRCRYPKQVSFKNYGGRGITVCERWNSFEAFLADMGPKPTPQHTIEREDNDGNYEPGNCRWATRREQQQNRRPFSKRSDRLA